jgi:hypothetical protein
MTLNFHFFRYKIKAIKNNDYIIIIEVVIFFKTSFIHEMYSSASNFKLFLE